jgi:hypothetical protein
VLIVDEMGKDVSGAGMDTKIVNRNVLGAYNPWSFAPKIERIFARNLTDETGGNAVGIGMLDVVTDRLVERIDWEPTLANALTANGPSAIRTPIHFPTDRECLETIAQTVGRFDLKDVTIGWIRNTLELGRLALSENLRPEIEANPQLTIVNGPLEIPYDAEGNLEEVLSGVALATAKRS